MTPYFVGVYWGVRAEAKLSYAERIFAFLLAVTMASGGTMRWYNKVTSKKTALKPLPTSIDELAVLLKLQLRDIGSEPMYELGYGFGAETGRDASVFASIAATVGAK